MRLLICFLIIFNLSCNNDTQQIAIVVHGGAGTILKKNMTEQMEKDYKRDLEEAISAGFSILENNGSSIDAVEATIKILENSDLFNAGKGSVLSYDGVVEMDASIMDGSNLNAGAVTGVKTIKNPISAARLVMEKSDHVLLSAKGAESFALSKGLEIIDNDYFITEKRLNLLNKAKKKDSLMDNKFGTVGCVAIDINGNISAGTSTGGMTNKRWNRIGDVPIIGAGNYANNLTCGISSTGWGEFFIRNVVAYDISSQMEYKKESIESAAKNTLKKVKNLGGSGGVIGIDNKGNIMMNFNTEGMYRGYKKSGTETVIKIYK
tara:strand:- start:195 stop:1154 length:960 start_codon:yes stop_codon:yes gene_type:complete